MNTNGINVAKAIQWILVNADTRSSGIYARANMEMKFYLFHGILCEVPGTNI